MLQAAGMAIAGITPGERKPAAIPGLYTNAVHHLVVRKIKKSISTQAGAAFCRAGGGSPLHMGNNSIKFMPQTVTL